MECDATAWLVTSLIPTLIANLAATPQPFRAAASELSENRQFHEQLSENDFDIFCILPNCANMRKGTIRKLSDKMVQIFYDYPKRENNYPKVFPASNSCPRQYPTDQLSALSVAF